MGRTTRTTKKPIKCNNTLRAMIVYNNSAIENLRQFILEALPNKEQKSLFIKQGIIKVNNVIYISDTNNLLSDIKTIKPLLK